MKTKLQTMPAPLTYEDYCLIPDDGMRHEIIDGVHHVSPAPFTRHQRILGNLFYALSVFVENQGIGSVWFAPVDIVFSNRTIVQPDLLFISNNRKHILTEKNVQGAPDLLVEILSNSTRRYDEITKRKTYEQFGVLEYWIVDPDSETVKVYQLENGVYGPPALFSLPFDPLIKTTLLPGFELHLKDIFPSE